MDRKHRVYEFPRGTVLPKPVKPAYFLFCYQETLKAVANSKKEGGAKFLIGDNTKNLAGEWGRMDENTKAKYECLH